MFRSTMIQLCAWLLVSAFAAASYAEDKKLEPVETWKGSVNDKELRGKPPVVIASPQAFEALWKAWKLGEVPKVDFEKNLVVLQTTDGSRLNLILNLTEAGDLKVLGLATRDFGPGFRYVIAAVAREGVKTVNGEALPEK